MFSLASYFYWYTNPAFVAGNKFWIQTGLALVGGIGILLMEYMPLIMNLFQKKSIKQKDSNPNQIFIPKSFEQVDFECLIHLRNRVTEANSQDGFETVQTLNSIIFALHQKEKVMPPVKDV